MDYIGATLQPASEVKEILSTAKCPVTFAEIGVERERARRAIVYCKDIRARYTILHLASELGLIETWADQVLDLHHS